MKKIFLLTAAMVMSVLCATAQTPDEKDIVTDDNIKLEVITPAEPVTETKEQIKEREKLLRAHEDQMAYAKAANSMRRGYFVLLADNIQVGFSGYRRYDINSNSNFILVQKNDGIIQVAFNTSASGPNGLGGWTGKGTVRNSTIKIKDDGEVFMQYELVGKSVNADVSITLFGNSNRAVAQINGGTPITIYGRILPYRDNEHR